MEFLRKIGNQFLNFKHTADLSKKFENKAFNVMLPSKVKLNNGSEIPNLGFGTMNIAGDTGIKTLKNAIDIGYRCFDTAYYYQNEIEVGTAINEKIDEGVIERHEVYLITKLWRIHHHPEQVEFACRLSLRNLGLEYIDLYLIHSPFGYAYVDNNTLTPKDSQENILFSDVDFVDTWRSMEHLVELGLVKSIGVSNFNSEQIDKILQTCKIKPVINEIECSPALNQKKLIKFCGDRNIEIIAYTPLGKPRPDEQKPDFLYSDKIKLLSEKYNKTPAQITLKYLIDIGTIPIPKSSNIERMKENFDIFDFNLEPDDAEIMDCFDSGTRMFQFKYAENHKFYPFNKIVE